MMPLVPAYRAHRRNKVITRHLEDTLEEYKSQSHLVRAQINAQMKETKLWFKTVSSHSGYAFSGSSSITDPGGILLRDPERHLQQGARRQAWCGPSDPDSRSPGTHGKRRGELGGDGKDGDDVEVLKGGSGRSPDYVSRLRLQRSRSDVGVYPVMVPIYVVQARRDRDLQQLKDQPKQQPRRHAILTRSMTDSAIKLPTKITLGQKTSPNHRPYTSDVTGDNIHQRLVKRELVAPEVKGHSGPTRTIKVKVKAKAACIILDTRPSTGQGDHNSVLDVDGCENETRSALGRLKLRRTVSEGGKVIYKQNATGSRNNEVNNDEVFADRKSAQKSVKSIESDSKGKLEVAMGNSAKRVHMKTMNISPILQEESNGKNDVNKEFCHLDQGRKIRGLVQVPLQVSSEITTTKSDKPIGAGQIPFIKKKPIPPLENKFEHSPDPLEVRGEKAQSHHERSSHLPTKQEVILKKAAEDKNPPGKDGESDDVPVFTSVTIPEGRPLKTVDHGGGPNRRYSLFLNAWHCLPSTEDVSNRIIGRSTMPRPRYLLQKKFKRAVNLSILSQRLRKDASHASEQEQKSKEEQMKKEQQSRKSVHVGKFIRAVTAGKPSRYDVTEEEVRMSASQMRRARRSLTAESLKPAVKVEPPKTIQNKELEKKIELFLSQHQ